jgi:hypothetical protein
VCAVAAAGAGSAFAGEITGPFPNGHTLWTGTIVENGIVVGHTLQGNSICAFSGLNIPDEFGPGSEGTARVQSYGQIVAAGGKGSAPSPGVACNGHTGFLAGGGEG